tara:strand:+ start:85731 stop:85883 length:153 start_codon:yes stop_codon:yes gene_type:complete
MPSEKTARALAQAREIRCRFDSIDTLMEELDGEDEPGQGRQATSDTKKPA